MEYYVTAEANNDNPKIIIPQKTVEATLEEYRVNITEDLGGIEVLKTDTVRG